MARIRDLHKKKWIKEPNYKKAYAALEKEFVLASAVIDARNRAGLTQHELARKMRTTQPVIAPGERARAPLHADAGALGGGHRLALADPLRTHGSPTARGVARLRFQP